MSKSTVRKFGVGVASLALLASVAAPAMAATADNRLAGTDRYATAIEVAKTFKTSDTVYVAGGNVLADAVVAGKLTGGPLLLVNEEKSVQAAVANQIKSLEAKTVVVLGGTKAVSDEALKAIAGTAKTERVSGDDRFATAAKISAKLNPVSSDTIYLANGMTLADALAGGSLNNKYPILLTDGSGKLPKGTADEIKRLGATKVIALGGDAAVSNAELAAAAMINALPEDAKKQLEAAKAALAKAEMEMDGWITLAEGKTIADATIANATEKAAATATAPRINKSFTVTGGIFVKATLADGKWTVDPKANVEQSAVGDYADVKNLPAGQIAPNYNGTKDIHTAALTAWRAAAAYDPATFDTQANADFITTNDLDSALTKHAEIKSAFEALGIKIELTATSKGLDLKAKVPALFKDVAATATTKYTADDMAAIKKNFRTIQEKQITKLQDVYLAAKKANDAVQEQVDALKVQIARLENPGALSISRLAGADRYATALKIAQEAYPANKNVQNVYLANGMSFADAAVSGMLTNGPVVLVSADKISEDAVKYVKSIGTASFLGKANVKALGGASVIDDKVVDVAINAVLGK